MQLLHIVIFLFYISLIGFNNVEKPQIDIDLTKTKAVQALAFCKNQNFNTDFCILITRAYTLVLKGF